MSPQRSLSVRPAHLPAFGSLDVGLFESSGSRVASPTPRRPRRVHSKPMRRDDGQSSRCWRSRQVSRDFGYESKPSDRRARRVLGMSAVPPIATELVARGSPSLGAITGREQMQQNGRMPHSYSITSSARASSIGGTSRPSALAVFKLIVSWNLVGACTGRSAGFSPRRMRSRYDAARRHKSGMSVP